jgi:oligopeptide transport system permease protein
MMLKYITKRTILMIISILIVMAFLYIILTLSMYLIWTRYPFSQVFEITIHSFKNYLGRIYSSWDFGMSAKGIDVWELVWPKLLLSLKYNFVALFIYVFFGVLFGVFAAVRKNKTTDVFVSVFSMIFQSIPSFIIAFFLVMYVGYKWNLLIPQAPYYSAPFLEQLEGMIIPVVSLSLWPLGKFTQMIRGEIIEKMNSDYFLLLRAKGLTKAQAVFRHTLKDAITTVIPEIIPTFVIVIGMSFFVESIYNIQGISNLLMDSIVIMGDMYSQVYIDVNVVVAISVFLYGAIMVTALFSDILLSVLDPRVRITGKKI